MDNTILRRDLRRIEVGLPEYRLMKFTRRERLTCESPCLLRVKL